MRNGVTLKLFLTVRSCLHSERCLLTIPDKSKNSNSYHTAVVKICSIQGKPKLQEQETEKHICTSAQTHTTSTHGYHGSISCTQHHRSHTNISADCTPWRKSELVVFSQAETNWCNCSCGSLVQTQEAEKHPPLTYCNKKLKSILVTSSPTHFSFVHSIARATTLRTLSSDCELSSTETRSWEASL